MRLIIKFINYNENSICNNNFNCYYKKTGKKCIAQMG